jgi:hypothetical protein
MTRVLASTLAILAGATVIGCGSSSPKATTGTAGAGGGAATAGTGGGTATGAAGTGGTAGGGGGAAGMGAAGTAAGGTGGSGGTGGMPSIGAGGMSMAVIADAGAAPAGCAANALEILFSTMYSAYDGVHTFQIPAVVNGLDPTEVAITWSTSDPTMVSLELDPDTGGVMITTRKSGSTMIFANAGSLCGSAPINITAATPDQWTAGSMRYNSGIIVDALTQVRRPPDGGLDVECTSCHGPTATNGPFRTVEHTPEQTGGFSDTDLINIFQNGMVPAGGYFDASIVSYQEWQGFHKWDVGNNAQGLVVYLRSLVPAAQTGSFGGMFSRPDGGFRGPRDGGGGPPPDAAVGQ